MAISPRRRLIRKALKRCGAANPYSLFLAKSLKGKTTKDLGAAAKDVGKKWSGLTDAQKAPFMKTARENGAKRAAMKRKFSKQSAYTLFVKNNFAKAADGNNDVTVVMKRIANMWKSASSATKSQLKSQAESHNKTAEKMLS